MQCVELEKLRGNVRLLQAKRKDLHLKSLPLNDRRSYVRLPLGSSLEFLKRRIARASADIEQHLASHCCLACVSELPAGVSDRLQ